MSSNRIDYTILNIGKESLYCTEYREEEVILYQVLGRKYSNVLKKIRGSKVLSTKNKRLHYKSKGKLNCMDNRNERFHCY